MGWIVVIAIKPLFAAVPIAGIVWLLAGGLFYTVGVVFFACNRIPYNHAVWHVFVLAGSICHYFAVLFYVLHANQSELHMLTLSILHEEFAVCRLDHESPVPDWGLPGILSSITRTADELSIVCAQKQAPKA